MGAQSSRFSWGQVTESGAIVSFPTADSYPPTSGLNDGWSARPCRDDPARESCGWPRRRRRVDNRYSSARTVKRLLSLRPKTSGK